MAGSFLARSGRCARRRLLGGVMLAVLSASVWVRPAAAQGTIDSYIVVDASTKKVLMAANATKKRPVASLTKIATACVVLDWAERTGADLNQLAVIPQSAASLQPNPFGFAPGDRISLRDALCCAMMGSDNIAAETLAQHVGGDLMRRTGKGPTPFGVFVKQMNSLAATLGMGNTKFLNPHGLDNASSVPYSTSADMARLTLYAQKKPAFYFYTSQSQRKVSFEKATGGRQTFLLKNTNTMVGANGVDGVKTGTTAKAGQCVIISAARKNLVVKTGADNHQVFPRRLVVVVLGASDRFRDAAGLLDSGWARYDQWVAAGRPITAPSELLDPSAAPAGR